MGELPSATYDGLDEAALAARLNLPRVEVHARVASTMDLAHARADAGAPAGTMILAETQEAGRGRGGKRWASLPGQGIWMTLVERPASPRGLDVLSLRLGLALAEALDRFAGTRVGLKWPNDLFVDGRKLAGILIEARWRDQRVDWVAVGIGINVRRPDPDLHQAAALQVGTARLQVLEAVVAAARRACAGDGPLADGELDRYAARDWAVGRRIVEPVAGVVAGIGAGGELLVDAGSGRVTCRAGSMVFAEEA